MKMFISFMVVICMITAGFAHGEMIVHYNMEDSASPLTDQVGGETADAVDAGQVYGVAGPSGFGNAVGLTGNGAWQLDVDESAELNNLTNDFTVAAWVNLDSSLLATKEGPNANNNRIIGDDVAWDGDAWSFGVRNGTLIFTKNGIVDAHSSVAVAADQWVHVAAVVSSTAGIDFYLDGALAGNHGNTANNNVGDDLFGIGRSYGNGEAQWFAGNLDEIRVYDEILDADAIALLAVPEPVTLTLFALGGILIRKRR